MRSGILLYRFIPEVLLSPGPAPPLQVIALGILLHSMRINHRHWITHSALTPLTDIKGQVQYPQVLVCLVPTRKPVNQYLLSP